MTKDELIEKFNSLPREYRTIIIGNELLQEILFIQREKNHAIREHAKVLERHNDKIKRLQREFHKLNQEEEK